jgi:hypothetical protein
VSTTKPTIAAPLIWEGERVKCRNAPLNWTGRVIAVQDRTPFPLVVRWDNGVHENCGVGELERILSDDELEDRRWEMVEDARADAWAEALGDGRH